MSPSRKKRRTFNNPGNTELLVGQPQKQVLSQAQQTFNRLSRKIASLQQELAETSQLLDKQVAYYGKHIYPLKQELTDARKRLCKILMFFYTDDKLIPKKDKHILAEIIIRQLGEVFANTPQEPDAEMKAIFAVVTGTTYEETRQQELDQLKNQMAGMFEHLGFQVDAAHFRPGMTRAEMKACLRDLEDNAVQDAYHKLNDSFSGRKQTKKQLEKEAEKRQAAEIQSKSISRIYKQLAKILHPDLEMDVTLKANKEVQMRELTTAYKKNDLHTLLRLELEWAQKEEVNLDTLTDEKLTIYNSLLQAQTAALQSEIYAMAEHPRYQVLLPFASSPFKLKSFNLAKVKKQLQENLSTLQESMVRFNRPDAAKEVKKLIRFYRRQE